MNNRKVINISHYNSSLLFLCWLKENEAKERAFRGGEKNPVHHARQLAERRNRRCERTHSPSLLGPMLSHEEKKMRSILILPLRSHPSCLRPGFPSFGEIQTSLYSALTIGKRSAPLPCYGRRIFSVTPQVGEMTYSNREIQRIQLWQDATVSSEVPPCNLLFCCLRPSLPAFDKAHASMALPSLSANSLCFVSFIFSGRRKKERNEGKNFYYHTNHLGSTAFVTDNNATITQGFLYAPFGEITTEYNSTFGNDIIPKYSFNAKELDEETGMYYYEARYYKPPVFTSRDAMMDQKPWLTPYHYCSNNPVGRVDPSGMLDTDFGVMPNGKVKQIGQSNDNPDRLYALDNKGNKKENVKPITVKDKTLLPSLAGKTNLNPLEKVPFETFKK